MALQTGRTVMVKLKDVRVGSIVMVRGNFGTGAAVRAVVAGVELTSRTAVLALTTLLWVPRPATGHILIR